MSRLPDPGAARGRIRRRFSLSAMVLGPAEGATRARAQVARLGRPTRRLLEAHWPFLLVLCAGALLRLAAAIAYRPALFYSDSNLYAFMAYAGHPVLFTSLRPNGYSILLWLLSVPTGRSLGVVTSAQHLAGLLTAGIVYVLLLRLAVHRLVAAAAAAVLLLDSYAVALEQHVLTEAFFTFMLVLAVWLTLRKRHSAWVMLIAGALLATATVTRPTAIAVVPVWLIYIAVTRRRPLLVGIAALAVMVPLLAYAGVYHHKTGTFGITQSEGWFLYGRIGSIVDCRGLEVEPSARVLCVPPQVARQHGPNYWLFNPASPAERILGGPTGDFRRAAQLNVLLRKFALTMIRAPPLAYLSAVGKDFARGLGFGHIARSDSSVRLTVDPFAKVDPAVQGLLPGFHAKAHAPSRSLARYPFHAPVLLFGLLALIAALACLFRVRHRPEILLLLGSGLALILLPVATTDLDVRYAVPAEPLLIAAGALGIASITTRLRAWGKAT